MMVKSRVYKGIEYVQLSELPREQQEMIGNSLNRNLTIKILVNGKIVPDCLQFRDYIIWYESIYKVQSKPEESVEPKPVKNKIPSTLAVE